MLKRFFDLIVSILLLVILSPLLVLFTLLVAISSTGGPFYLQQRVGRYGRPFWLLKFRTMRPGAETKGLLTVGNRDNRITRVGYYLRKYKLDELPQLWNVLAGDMSMVGPRPEVPKYVKMYTPEQRQVLQVKPGITDPASIAYRHENEVLRQYDDPEKAYVEIVMPAKIEINNKYLKDRSLLTDIKVMLQTVKVLFH